jgi:hypothetical protein
VPPRLAGAGAAVQEEAVAPARALAAGVRLEQVVVAAQLLHQQVHGPALVHKFRAWT